MPRRVAFENVEPGISGSRKQRIFKAGKNGERCEGNWLPIRRHQPVVCCVMMEKLRHEPMKHFLIRLVFRMTATLVVIVSPTAAFAGGTCLLHPEPFKLQSDTVHWSVRITSGSECIQGLRWSTIMIDSIAVTEQPKAGRLVVQGPSFRYFSKPRRARNQLVQALDQWNVVARQRYLLDRGRRHFRINLGMHQRFACAIVRLHNSDQTNVVLAL